MNTTIEGLTIRSCCLDDVPALHEIDHEFQAEVGFGTEDHPFYPHPDIDDLENTYTNAGGVMWAIEHDREIVAYGGVMRVDDETARLRRFRVRRAWRRRGIATMLLRRAEDFCRERGYRRITLSTSHRQPAAQALYRKHGYVETRRYPFREDLIEIEFEKVAG
jgi:ribosomal protein S18 acetylase RimI-like enzyme